VTDHLSDPHALDGLDTLRLDYRYAGLRLPSVRSGVLLIASGWGTPATYGRAAITAATAPLAQAIGRFGYIGVAVALAVARSPSQRG
jgi:hypothetical protein